VQIITALTQYVFSKWFFLSQLFICYLFARNNRQHRERNSWRAKDQLDVTGYFISLPMCATCFGHQYIHYQELATLLLNYHIGCFVLGSLCVGDLLRLGLSSVRAADNTDTTKHCNTQRTENKTTDVVIQQHSRKLLMMDILMFEKCWVHKTWNKITSDIKLVFYASTITMMHGPINMRFTEKESM